MACWQTSTVYVKSAMFDSCLTLKQLFAVHEVGTHFCSAFTWA